MRGGAGSSRPCGYSVQVVGLKSAKSLQSDVEEPEYSGECLRAC